MEPLSPEHPTSLTTSQEQKSINLETGIVQLPGPVPAPAVGQHDADRGDANSTGQTSPAPAPPAISTWTTSPSSFALAHSSAVQQYSPTQTEIETHPIRQRLSLSGEHVAASGWGKKDDKSESQGVGRQEEPVNIEAAEGAKDSKMTEVKEGDKGMWPCATAMEMLWMDAIACAQVRLRPRERIERLLMPKAPRLLTRAELPSPPEQ